MPTGMWRRLAGVGWRGPAAGAIGTLMATLAQVPAAAQQVGGARVEAPAAVQVPPNTTIVPRSNAAPRAAATGTGPGLVTLTALLTDEGQNIEQGLVWRVFRLGQGPEKTALIAQHRDPNPTVRLEPGTYLVNVAFGRAHLTRRIVIAPEQAGQERQERFVLNAGGLRVTGVFTNDIFSDERDQYGQRTKVVSAIKTGVIVRLNAGIYSVLSTYGDANATARADVTVEAGKLTEATLSHAAAKVTFKLVVRAGGDAMPDTQWTVTSQRGDPVKESVGALPTHILAPGRYTVVAKHAGQQFRRDFAVRTGDVAQVELVMP